MVAKSLTLTDVEHLHEGDCFLWASRQTDERFSDVKEDDQRALYREMFAEPHLVYARTIEGNHVCSQRITDGKRFIWYSGEGYQVWYTDDLKAFEERLESLKEWRKQHEEAERKAQQKRRKAKKMRQEDELAERTLIAQV